MNIFKKIFYVFVIFLILFISCDDPKTSEEQIAETIKRTERNQAELDSIERASDPVLDDTIGLYKLNDVKAREYIVKMNQSISEINRELDKEKAGEDSRRKYTLVYDMQTLQRTKRMSIQSALDKTDLDLFKMYAHRVTGRLAAILKRLENKMEKEKQSEVLKNGQDYILNTNH